MEVVFEAAEDRIALSGGELEVEEFFGCDEIGEEGGVLGCGGGQVEAGCAESRVGVADWAVAVAAAVRRVSSRVGRAFFMRMVILAFWWFKLMKKAIRQD